MELASSKILLTGASSGIGRAIALLLQEQGAQLFLTGKNDGVLSDVRSATGMPGRAFDLYRGEKLDSLVREVHETLGGLDVLINNAGLAYARPLEDIQMEDLHEMYAVNVFAPTILAKLAAEHFIEQGYGHIVNIGATGGQYGFKGGAVYGSSKAAFNHMTGSLQEELRVHNIRVIHLDPSWVTGTSTYTGELIQEEADKLSPSEVAHSVQRALEMDDRAMIKGMRILATNPRSS